VLKSHEKIHRTHHRGLATNQHDLCQWNDKSMKAKAMAAIPGVAIIAAILMHLFDQRRFSTAENRDRALLAQLQEQAKADQGVELKVFVDGLPMPGGAPGSQVSVLTFVKEGDEWKWADGTLHSARWDENGDIEKFIP
jgi:hypothetical protein